MLTLQELYDKRRTTSSRKPSHHCGTRSCLLLGFGAIVMLSMAATALLHRGYIDVDALVHPDYPNQAQETTKTTKVTGPRICKQGNETKAPPNWILFFGDSNMRNTYNWFSSGFNKASIYGSTYGIDKDRSYQLRWADQEVLEKGSGSSDAIVRYSFRFLHGQVSEFVHKARQWDIATQAAELRPGDMTRNMSTSFEMEKNDELWRDKIRPSDFALWATRFQTPLKGNSSEFNSWMRKWKNQTNKSSPDVVIMTQGWGGVPRSEEMDIVKTIVLDNPETLFIWSPLYVTDRQQSRYDSYVQAGTFDRTEHNLRTIDLMDMARTLPRQSKGGNLHHIPVGGTYMRKGMSKLWSEVTACTGESNRIVDDDDDDEDDDDDADDDDDDKDQEDEDDDDDDTKERLEEESTKLREERKQRMTKIAERIAFEDEEHRLRRRRQKDYQERAKRIAFEDEERKSLFQCLKAQHSATLRVQNIEALLRGTRTEEAMNYLGACLARRNAKNGPYAT